jgi:energy-coupling factor transporter ATP-binding protein EcfA2
MFQQITLAHQKSFISEVKINPSPGMNLVIGRNNAGKTALLQMLNVLNPFTPSRSIKDGRGEPLVDPYREFIYNFSKDEFRRLIRVHGEKAKVTFPHNSSAIASRVMESDSVSIVFRHEQGRSWAIEAIYVDGNAVNVFNDEPFNMNTTCIISVKYDYSVQLQIVGGGGGKSLAQAVADYLAANTYEFKAERFSVGRCSFRHTDVLNADASNLPCVIRSLESKGNKIDYYNKAVRLLLPDIYGIRTAHIDDQQIEIRVWNYPFDSGRDDLAISLTDCGTGVGQILSILYVIFSSDTKKTIIIDEPNSFLHPSAARELMRIIAEHSQHQYFISTHSAETIMASPSATIHLLRKVEGETVITTSRPSVVGDLVDVMKEVGVRVGDVYGRENIVWVEGDTEAACFSLCLPPEKRSGVDFIALLNVGQITSKKAATKAIIDIYQKLSLTSALAPQTLRFSLDREGLTDQQIADIKRSLGEKVAFLPRRCFENFLIHPLALKKVIYNSNNDVTEEKLHNWLIQNGGNTLYKGHDVWKEDIFELKWLEKVDGARLLDAMLFENGAIVYDKVKHGRELAVYLLKHERGHLIQLVEHVAALLDN